MRRYEQILLNLKMRETSVSEYNYILTPTTLKYYIRQTLSFNKVKMKPTEIILFVSKYYMYAMYLNTNEIFPFSAIHKKLGYEDLVDYPINLSSLREKIEKSLVHLQRAKDMREKYVNQLDELDDTQTKKYQEKISSLEKQNYITPLSRALYDTYLDYVSRGDSDSKKTTFQDKVGRVWVYKVSRKDDKNEEGVDEFPEETLSGVHVESNRYTLIGENRQIKANKNVILPQGTFQVKTGRIIGKDTKITNSGMNLYESRLGGKKTTYGNTLSFRFI